MARKVFISFLGSTDYNECDYQKDKVSYGKVRFIQEATLNYLIKKENWTKNDLALILLTKTAENANWVDDGHIDSITNQPKKQMGLYSRLLQFNISIKPIKDLPDGNYEKEIFEIFERTFNEIEKGDELYFDITHGFRYLPMLILVLGNYAKFLKDVVVKSITYGNFEISKRGTQPGSIVDLLPLSQLQDWTFAAGQYIDSGNVDKLFTLSNRELNPILAIAKGSNIDATNLKQFVRLLKTVIEERQTCRGISIVKSENFKKLKEVSEVLKTTIIEPLNPVIDKIKESFTSFDVNENVSNGFAAAQWCYDNALYQQAATILHENMITAICMQEDLNWTNEDDRSVVNIAFKVKIDNLEEKDWNLGLKKDATEEEKEQKRKLIRETFKNKLFVSFIGIFNAMNGLRNDFNHSGMRNNPMNPLSLQTKLGNMLADVINLYNEENNASS